MAPKARGRSSARGRDRGGRNSRSNRATDEVARQDVIEHGAATEDSQTVAEASTATSDRQEATAQSLLETPTEPQRPAVPIDELEQAQLPSTAPAQDSGTQQSNTQGISNTAPLSRASQPSSSTPSASRPQSQRGAKKPGPGPRAPARRSKEEREALNLAEEERRRARELAHPVPTSTSSGFGTTAGRGRGQGRGRGRGGRGRGREGFVSGEAVASGPFSAGTVSADLKKRKRGGGIAGGRQSSVAGERIPGEEHIGGGTSQEVGSSGGAASRGRGSRSKSVAKTGPKSKVKAPRVKKEGESKTQTDDDDIAKLGLPRVKKEDPDGGYISSDTDAENEGPRRNIDQIDHITLSSDEEDETGAKNQATHQRLPIPVRLPRKVGQGPYKAGEVESGWAATTHEGFGKTMKEDMSSDVGEGKRPRYRGHNKGTDVEFIRDERAWHGVYEDDENTDVAIKQEPSDDVMEIDTVPTQTDVSEIQKEPPSSPEKKKKGGNDTTKTKTAASKFDLHTEQDKIATGRQQRDAQTLIQELGQIPVLDGSGTSEIRDGRVYLFQFPPVVPDLTPADLAVNRKQDGSTDQAEPKEPPGVISRSDKKPIKVEDSNTTKAQHHGTHGPILSPGIAGKLRVHKSGRTTLNWGGTSMELNMGAKLTYLQDVLVAKGLDEGDGWQGTSEKGAYGLGVIRGKFVVTPDWEEVIP